MEVVDYLNLPQSKHTVDELMTYRIKRNENINRIRPPEKLRYAIYLRKSTDGEDRQVRSLPDQEKECRKLAADNNIKIRNEDVLKESASAKKSGSRPVFTNLLQAFRTGKYHGLIAWSPDRISRNMKEAGEVIEMIDTGQIQELMFRTYHFENTPNGKMMLGILFATSKQYSDKLSVDVMRGISGNVSEGKYNGSLKKGYYVDEESGRFYPDMEYWKLLRRAVMMRLYENKTSVQAAQFLSNSDIYVRKTQTQQGKLVKFSDKMLGKLFADSFYCGLYQVGDNIVNLDEEYGFVPLMTVDEYIALNKEIADDFNIGAANTKRINKRLDYGLLRDKVICDYCKDVMKFQNTRISKGKNAGRWVINYYCRTKTCKRREPGSGLGKSVRAFILSDAIYHTLQHCTKRSKEAYDIHIASLKIQIAEESAIARRKLAESKTRLKKNQTELAQCKNLLLSDSEEYKKHFSGRIEDIQAQIDVTQFSIEQSENELKRLKASLPTEDEFYKLIDSYLLKLRETTDLMEKDAIYNILVSNLYVADDRVSVIKLNPPYNLMADLEEISLGWG